VLVDMDGCLVDWDAGFAAAWKGRSPITRSLSYAMEECVPPDFRQQAMEVFHSEGFFLGLPPMAGGVAALHALAARGYRVFLCTAPVTTSAHCAGEKFEWVRHHLGPEWVPKIILTSDKTAVRGDVLIDDKPAIRGTHNATWQQLMFDAPYNLKCAPTARIGSWALDEVLSGIDALLCAGAPPRPTGTAGAAGAGVAGDDVDEATSELEQLRSAVAALPDFSHLLPPDYRKDYSAWRAGREKGAHGELGDAMRRMDAMQDSVLNNTADDFSEITVFREGYAAWRRGRSGGAKSFSQAEAASLR